MCVRSASWRCSTSASAPVSAPSASGPRRRSAPGTLQSASCGDACASNAALVHVATTQLRTAYPQLMARLGACKGPQHTRAQLSAYRVAPHTCLLGASC